MTVPPVTQELSERELQIVLRLSYGMGNVEIGRELLISPNTVKAHLVRIASKLGTGSRAGMVGVAFRAGLIS